MFERYCMHRNCAPQGANSALMTVSLRRHPIGRLVPSGAVQAALQSCACMQYCLGMKQSDQGLASAFWAGGFPIDA